MKYRLPLLLLIALLGEPVSLIRAQTAPPLPATRPATLATREMAEPWYRMRFGKDLTPADIDRLYAGHLLVEAYFQEIPTARRDEIVRALEALKISPRETAALCTLRLNWQATEPGIYYINDHIGPAPVHYFVGVPKGYIPGNPRPVILMLPTATAFLVKKNMTANDVAQIYTTWIRDELARRPDNIVVMPLLHMTDLWGPGYAGMNNAMKPLQDVCERFTVDTQRVYLRGQGMSGHAVWNLGLHYPTYFAAINPLAGGATYDWQRMRILSLRNTLPVVWHDADDKDVPVKLSRDLVAALRKNKIDVSYEETKKAGHTPGPDIEQRLYERMIARARELYPKTVALRTNRPDVAFGRADWVQLWQPMESGDEVRNLFRWSGTGMWTYQNPVTIEARLVGGNKVEIESKNLGALRLLFVPEMIDMTRAISVIVNKKVVYEGPVTEKVETVLKDQLSLGRGWREYTAALDIDLIPPAATRPATQPTN